MNKKTLAFIKNQMQFRPFTLRVNSGALYEFDKPEQFGATGDMQVIIHFTQSRFSIIDASSVNEIIENSPPDR